MEKRTENTLPELKITPEITARKNNRAEKSRDRRMRAQSHAKWAR